MRVIEGIIITSSFGFWLLQKDVLSTSFKFIQTGDTAMWELIKESFRSKKKIFKIIILF